MKRWTAVFLSGLFWLGAALSGCNGNAEKQADGRSASAERRTDETGAAGTDCEDGVCQVPDVDEAGREVYAIVSPVGYNEVEMIDQAPRLDTLDGKTVALVGGSFMASVTHRELKNCILAEYPTAKIYMFDEVGAGGPYSVYGQSAKTVAFQEKLKELGVDAVISGNCGCGLCTTKECGSSIAAEYLGIPTVTVGAPSFIAEIHSTGVNRGVPVLRTAMYPGAFASHSNEELVRNTRETVWPEVKKALTEAVTEEEVRRYANAGKRPYDEIVYYGNYEEIQEFCRVNEWTDGLPVTPATDELVREYLKFTPDPAEKVLGIYPLAYRECTVYTVAVNAVMAGLPKELMPVAVAFTECLGDGEWRRPLASTHGWTPYAWLNGPLARQLGIDAGQGMISEEMNKALGRFIDLALLNLGGYYVKENRMGTFGYLSPWTFAEDEEACAAVGWEPYHVTLGYEWDDNTVTAGSALAWGNNVTPATDDAEEIMKLMAFDITEKQQNGLGNTNPQVYRTLFVTEYVARDLSAKYPTKRSLEDALIETARRPLYLRAYAHYWANTGSKQYTKRTLEEHYEMLAEDPKEQAAMTETPDWLRGIVDEPELMTIATMNQGETPILVTGDGSRNKFQVMPGGGYVTVRIRLPENWDALVSPLGYEPLEHFSLEAQERIAPSESGTKAGENDESEDTVIPAPEFLGDGTYRLVPAESQVSGEGRVFSDGNTFMYYENGRTVRADEGLPSLFLRLLGALNPASSFTVRDGRVTALILRFSTVAKRTSLSFRELETLPTDGLSITVAVNLKQSAEGGAVTPGGTSILLPSSIVRFQADLGGPVAEDRNNGAFLTVSDGTVTLDPGVPSGTTAKIGASGGASYRVFTLKRTTEGISIYYESEGVPEL